MNRLFCGDNLEILRDYITDESVDLVYLDPPFKSDSDYNLLFREKTGGKSSSQILAFEDTWEWNQEAQKSLSAVVQSGGKVGEVLSLLHHHLGETDMLAYLAMMASRLAELRRVMKSTATLYLHCDATASHYLKMLLDGIFGPQSFLNEVTWKRTHSHGNVGKNYGSICDVLLVYTKSDKYVWNQQFTTFGTEYVNKTFKYEDADGRRWQSVTLRNPSVRPNLQYRYKASNGITYMHHPNGWVCDKKRMKLLDKQGRLHFPKNADGALRLKMYYDESSGVRLQNLWDDIPALGAKAAERLGYPTQKPLALLQRIIATSSSPGDTVLDPFCGCGTAIEAAQVSHRRWIGIDITEIAVQVVENRLRKAFGPAVVHDYKLTIEPRTVSAAEALAVDNPREFQDWIVRKLGGSPTISRGSDRGVDGRLYFKDDVSGPLKQIIVSVKSGKHLSPAFVRELRGTLERERGAMGILITLNRPSKQMERDAASSEPFTSLTGTFPRIQIITVDDILSGAILELPIIQRAPALKKHAVGVTANQMNLPGIAR